MAKLIHLPYEITISVGLDGSAHLTSRLGEQFIDKSDGVKDVAGRAATDVFESVLLALAAAGVPLDTREAWEAVETAVDQAANMLD